MEKFIEVEQPLPGEVPVPKNLNVLVGQDELKKLEAEAENATRDPLTHLLNRRGWDEEMAKLINEYRRHPEDYIHKEYAILTLDIDFFKKINDTYGHQGGDIVLEDASKYLSALFRSTDVIARFGGEEFVILIKDGDLGKIKERLMLGGTTLYNEDDKRNPVINFSTKLSHEGTEVTREVSFSGGLVACVPDSKESIDEAIKRADALLYEAKLAGRNRIIFSEEKQG